MTLVSNRIVSMIKAANEEDPIIHDYAQHWSNRAIYLWSECSHDILHLPPIHTTRPNDMPWYLLLK